MELFSGHVQPFILDPLCLLELFLSCNSSNTSKLLEVLLGRAGRKECKLSDVLEREAFGAIGAILEAVEQLKEDLPDHSVESLEGTRRFRSPQIT